MPSQLRDSLATILTALTAFLMTACATAHRPLEIQEQGSFTVGGTVVNTGAVRVDPLFQATDATRAGGSLVTFDAGARSAWHTHPLGQVLIVTAGTGRVQQWGQPIDEIRVGDVVHIPPNAKHWHGAAPATSMALIAMNRPDQLRSHLARARENGVTHEELVETITHLAFYAGWPSAISAVSVAKEVLQEDLEEGDRP